MFHTLTIAKTFSFKRKSRYFLCLKTTRRGSLPSLIAVLTIGFQGVSRAQDAQSRSVGYRGSWGEINYDIGGYYYYYPGAASSLHSDFDELGAKLSWGKRRVIPILEAYVSSNYFFGAGKSIFVWSGADFALPASAAASVRIGYVAVENSRAFIYPDYLTWLLSAAKEFVGLTWSLQLTDTSMTRQDCTDGSRCSMKFTVKIAKNF